MIGAGRLYIAMTDDESRVEVRLKRDNIAQQLCHNQTLIDARDRLSNAYTLCKHAQSAAAEMALFLKSPDALCQRRVSLEIIEQTLWRWLVDLPRVVGYTEKLADYAQLRKALVSWQNSLSVDYPQAGEEQPDHHDYIHLAQRVEKLLGVQLMEFEFYSADALLYWLEQKSLAATIIRAAGEAEVPDNTQLLTMSQLAQASSQILKENKTPQGETSAYAELKELFSLQVLAGALNPLQLRLISRLIFLSETYNSLRLNRIKHRFGFVEYKHKRMSWVMTARGLLIHKLSLQTPNNTLVENYQVIAPTDLNFGCIDLSTNFYSKKTDLMQGKALRRILELSVLTLDPCVDYDIEVVHA